MTSVSVGTPQQNRAINPFDASSSLTLVTAFANVYDVAGAATGGVGTLASPWTGWETPLNLVAANLNVHFRAGYYTQATRIEIKNGWVISGDGENNTVITSAFTGTAFRSDENPAAPFAALHRSHWTVRDLKLVNTNPLSVGSGILAIMSVYNEIRNVQILGFKAGIVQIGCEVATIEHCFVEFQMKVGIWYVSNGDYKPANGWDFDYSGAPYGATNIHSIRDTALNNLGTAGLVAIANDGVIALTIDGSAVNGWFNGLRVAASPSTSVTGMYMEGPDGYNVTMEATSLYGVVMGPNGNLNLDTCWFSGPFSAGRLPISVTSATRLILNGCTMGGAGSSFIFGGSNVNTLFASGNNVATLLYDASPTHRFVSDQLQSFVFWIDNDAGTIRHQFFSDAEGQTAALDASRITGQSSITSNTPTVAAGVDFVAGAGISSTFTNGIAFNTATVTKPNGVAVIEDNTTGTALSVIVALRSENINGVTHTRLYFRLKNAATGAAVPITTGNIPAGTHIAIRYQGSIE